MSGVIIHHPPQTVSEALNGGISDRGSFEGPPEQSHMSITSIIAFVEGLPDADYYLIEEMLPILPKVWFSLSLNHDQRKTS